MKRLIISIMFLALVLAGCAVPEKEGVKQTNSITLMTWNVQNLFDGKDDGFEYSEFKLSSGWSQEKYLGRLNSISAAISELPKKPDIIMFQEIESGVILENLSEVLSEVLSEEFLWYCFASNHGSNTGVGILSRLPLSETPDSVRAHTIFTGDAPIPRPVLEVRIDGENAPFVIFVNHWKSKLGGDNATEYLRKASARIILRRIRELQAEDPQIGVIIAGDLNLNHDDFLRRGSSFITALVPDEFSSVNRAGVQSELYGQKDYLILSGSKPPAPVNFSDEHIVLYSPWIEELENGSYFYKDTWETIDHFLLSHHFFNGSDWEYEQAEVVNHHPFADADGIPQGYNARTGNGLSDHLPLVVTLTNAAF